MNEKTQPDTPDVVLAQKPEYADDSERDSRGLTPEMRERIEQLTHPKGDPYDNARRLGFYCEQCG